VSPAGLDELRRAASVLDTIAADVERVVSRIATTSRAFRSLPKQIEAVISGTATRVDQQVVSHLTNCGTSIAQAEAALRATATQTRRSAEAVRTRAAQIERGTQVAQPRGRR